ncbi:MAG: hypothetical protein QNJ36_01250 [Calothrix sp. MO_167.B42]|nr:hypothetical protein [Calothrix sp. MO_167.B42]
MSRKTSDRWVVMLPKRCQPLIENMLEQTGIDSIGKLLEILVIRHQAEFVQSYNEFMKRTEPHSNQTPRNSQGIINDPSLLEVGSEQ